MTNSDIQIDLIEYLDRVIDHWRNALKNAQDSEETLVDMCYIDAFQSVRVSAFGELKPPATEEA